jgi:hypothetical protein
MLIRERGMYLRKLKFKMYYNNNGKLDRMLSNGHQYYAILDTWEIDRAG